MKFTSKFTLALALAAVSATAAASDNWVNRNGLVWKNVSGLCWQDRTWTPATAAAACGQEKEAVVAQKVTFSADTFFAFDSAVLKPAGREILDKVAVQLQSLNLESAIATGHTDSVGTAEYNLGLSKRRANAVKSYLVSKGVSADQIVTVGKGEAEPASTNKTAPGRALNRRVVLEIVASK